jgi:hypothetical protein
MYESNDSIMKFRIGLEKISVRLHDVIFTKLVNYTFGLFLGGYESNDDDRPSTVNINE